MQSRIILGDSKTKLKDLADNTFHGCLTDPPYELGFMGKNWDSTGIAFDVDLWKEVLRVMKPGAHLLSFGGSRTYHRMACAIEDAGFEIRDQIMWVYSSGLPKSLDISKGIDKAKGAERDIIGTMKTNTKMQGGNYGGSKTDKKGGIVNITEAKTPEAKYWDGWGTALKPAHEPIVVARKPLCGSVVKNIFTHETGGLNIKDCRVPGEPHHNYNRVNTKNSMLTHGQESTTPAEGRYPANLIHDGSEEVESCFPYTKSGTNCFRTKEHQTTSMLVIWAYWTGKKSVMETKDPQQGSFIARKPTRRKKERGTITQQ